MEIKRYFRHVGYIVQDLKQSILDFQRLFDLRDEDIHVIPPFGLPADSRFAFFHADGLNFKLIEPISDHFKEILFNSGIGINHIYFTVDDIESAFAEMNRKGIRPGHVTPDGIITMPHQKIVYFNPEDTGGILLEYIEEIKR
ncbi:MAG TPA: VOC family protein [Anaerolineales bacterium]|nr:VOC family protein [Anaerolineales bacterium]